MNTPSFISCPLTGYRARTFSSPASPARRWTPDGGMETDRPDTRPDGHRRSRSSQVAALLASRWLAESA